MRRAAKIDVNQPAIVAALRRIGCLVQSLAAVGDGVPDLLVFSPYKRALVLVEIKDPSQPASKRRLRDSQVAFHETWKDAPIFVVETVDEAVRAVGGTN